MRIVFLYILPLLLPFVLYLFWASANKRKTETGKSHPLTEGPGFWFIVAGFSLMIGGLIYLAATDRDHMNKIYIPSVIKDGRIIPGKIR